MILTRKHLSAASLLILLMKVFSGHTLTCHQAQYKIGNECCPMCLAGSCVKTDCTEFSSTSCLPCSEGTYIDKPNGRRQCFQCKDCNSDSGLKTKTSCTASADVVCEPLEGFHCVEPSDDGCNAAKKYTSCEPGQYIRKEGTWSSDTVCSDCSDGTFSDGTFPSCRPHTQCGTKNLQLLKPGTSSSDAECGEQPPNRTDIVISISVAVVLVVLIICAIGFFIWKTKSHRAGQNTSQNKAEESVGLQPPSTVSGTNP